MTREEIMASVGLVESGPPSAADVLRAEAKRLRAISQFVLSAADKMEAAAEQCCLAPPAVQEALRTLACIVING